MTNAWVWNLTLKRAFFTPLKHIVLVQPLGFKLFLDFFFFCNGLALDARMHGRMDKISTKRFLQRIQLKQNISSYLSQIDNFLVESIKDYKKNASRIVHFNWIIMVIIWF